jgi:deoxyribodipyrimidine photo-lyase
MIQPERIKKLNQRPIQNRKFVLYWMQASQRVEYNHALEFAIQQANALKKPVVVYFGITSQFPEANLRHYQFMLEGLREVQQELAARGIKMIARLESPEQGVLRFAPNADLVVVDRGYLKIQRAWRQFVADRIDCPLIQVETDAIVPIEIASDKENYSAGTLRPRIQRQLARFLVPLAETIPLVSGALPDFDSIEFSNLPGILAQLQLDGTVPPVPDFRGGPTAAKTRLELFLNEKLEHYPTLRNDPTQDFQSHLSPFLHFGQISPLLVALKTLAANRPGTDEFLEELIVRRELSLNFVYYNANYDSIKCLPNWARQTLLEHSHESREYLYLPTQLERGETHDPYWNAAQQEMVHTGKMHGYLRMYWGKKILEWSATPETAFEIALNLNNKFELDGRDPNGFAGVAWCFGKHDRAWTERPVFGKIRYMNANGLKRKFDADAYVRKIRLISAAER